jgi:hypothetical protein
MSFAVCLRSESNVSFPLIVTRHIGELHLAVGFTVEKGTISCVLFLEGTHMRNKTPQLSAHAPLACTLHLLYALCTQCAYVYVCVCTDVVVEN